MIQHLCLKISDYRGNTGQQIIGFSTIMYTNLATLSANSDKKFAYPISLAGLL